MKYLDEEAFDEIEKSLNIKLPQHFKDFHLNERELIARLRNLDPEEDIILATDCKWIIYYNKDLKLPTYKGFANNKIWIGADGGGNNSFISLDEKDVNVYFLDHESWAEDAGVEYDEEIHELKFDFDNEDVDWSIFILGKNLTEYINWYIRILEEVRAEFARQEKQDTKKSENDSNN